MRFLLLPLQALGLSRTAPSASALEAWLVVAALSAAVASNRLLATCLQ